jgi:hypothetical protein
MFRKVRKFNRFTALCGYTDWHKRRIALARTAY